MKNPHIGSPVRTAFTPEEWHKIQFFTVMKAAKRSLDYPWCVYILENRDKTKLYTGITNDLSARLDKHNAGKGAKATRAKRPWRLVWRFLCRTKREAAFFEVRIKRLTRAKKLAMIADQMSLSMASKSAS